MAIKIVNPILYGTIVIATILLIIAFGRSIRERKSLTNKTKGGNSAKELRLVQSVIAVCVIFIVTSSLKNVVRIMDLINIRWRISPVYPYLPYIDELVDLREAVNHSINIFVYLVVNSKFRGRMKGVFGFFKFIYIYIYIMYIIYIYIYIYIYIFIYIYIYIYIYIIHVEIVLIWFVSLYLSSLWGPEILWGK